MPSPEVQIALANLDVLAGEAVLLAGFEGPELPEALTDRGNHVTVFQQELRAHRSWPDSSFGDWLDTSERFDVAALKLPKERGRLALQLAMVAGNLTDRGAVVLAGHNDAGIRSSGKQMAAVLDSPEVVDYRYHCRLLRAERRAGPVAKASLEAWRVESHAVLGDRTLTFITYPGVFSHMALDAGTRMLLETAEIARGARVLEVGSGSGVVSAWAALHGADVDAVDVDALALRATRETLAANGMSAIVHPSDVYSDVTDRYAAILCNPPFHAGVRTSSDVAMRLIEGAPERLKRGGVLWVVANRFLDYLEPLRATFAHVEIAREDKRFRVYRAK